MQKSIDKLAGMIYTKTIKRNKGNKNLKEGGTDHQNHKLCFIDKMKRRTPNLQYAALKEYYEDFEF